MAESIQVDGPCHVNVDTGAANALEELGFSINGVTITEIVFTSDVPGDQNGGDEGPPIDVQYFGEIHRIRMELSKYDELILDKVRPKLYGGTAGLTGTSGTLIIGASKTFRLLLLTTNRVRNYPTSMLRETPMELNKGTKFTRMIIEFEAHPVAGLLHNTVSV